MASQIGCSEPGLGGVYNAGGVHLSVFLSSGFGEGAVVALRLVLQKNPITCLDKRLEFLDHFDSAFVP